jgi:hypothetical protein
MTKCYVFTYINFASVNLIYGWKQLARWDGDERRAW